MIRVERKEKEISERDARAQQLELKRQELEVAEIQLELERCKEGTWKESRRSKHF